MFLKYFQLFSLILFFSPLPAFALDPLTIIGRVASVSPCQDASGYTITLQATSTPRLIYKKSLSKSYPAGTVPQLGQQIFGILGTTTACGPISGRFLSFFSSTTAPPPIFTPPPGSPGAGSGGNSASGQGNPISAAFSGIVQQIQNLLTPQGAGIGIFGGLITLISPCDEGFLYALAGMPYSGPLMWVYGVSAVPPYLYAMGTPPITATFVIGHYTAFSTCTLGLATIGGGPIMYGYGTGLVSLPSGGKPTAKPGTGNACLANQYDLTSKNGKAQAEAVARKALSSQGITANKSFCGVGVSFSKTEGGCTDVSGLQCSAFTNLQNLATKCGGFQITGGSEAGHSSQHSTGNAVDITGSKSLNSCIEKNFTQIQCPRSVIGNFPASNQCWGDSSTGSIYWNEPTVGDQGQHWHVCLNGYCKS